MASLELPFMERVGEIVDIRTVFMAMAAAAAADAGVSAWWFVWWWYFPVFRLLTAAACKTSGIFELAAVISLCCCECCCCCCCWCCSSNRSVVVLIVKGDPRLLLRLTNSETVKRFLKSEPLGFCVVDCGIKAKKREERDLQLIRKKNLRI